MALRHRLLQPVVQSANDSGVGRIPKRKYVHGFLFLRALGLAPLSCPKDSEITKRLVNLLQPLPKVDQNKDTLWTSESILKGNKGIWSTPILRTHVCFNVFLLFGVLQTGLEVFVRSDARVLKRKTPEQNGDGQHGLVLT